MRRASAAALALAALLALGASQAAGSGEPEARPSIVGGGKGDPRGWAFTVGLQTKRRLFCTGALIAPTKVLTAAHCAKKLKRKRFRAVAGSAWVAGKRKGEPVPARRVRLHPHYNGKKDLRDIAVITLRRPAPAPVIELPTRAEAKAGTRPGALVRSAGWGARSPWGFRLAERLKATKERVFGSRKCQRTYGKELYDPRSMICALGAEIRRDRSPLRFKTTSCSGDSGGPLVAATSGGPRIVGVVSAGPLPCGLFGASLYARVGSSLPFIRHAAGLDGG